MLNTTIKLVALLVSTSFLMISCNDTKNSEEMPLVEQYDYQAVGDSLSMISQQTLLSNVAREMQSGGPVHAIDFCNLNASSLMDSLSKEYKVKISRVTSQARNPSNKASESEFGILNSLKESNSKDTVVNLNDSHVYYKSIKLGMSTCLKCHGTSNDIDEKTMETIQDRYPNDQATNYQIGDFRGAWKIQFTD